MLKILPVILAIFLFLTNFQIFNGNYDIPDFSAAPVENKNPRNHLTQDSTNRNEVTAQILPVSEAASKNITVNRTEEKISAAEVKPAELQEKIFRITWQIVPRAVKYKISCEGRNYVSYTNGVEIVVKDVNSELLISALDFDNHVVENDVVLMSIEENPPAPLTTTEFDKMKLSPLYIVYSWIPTMNAHHYEIQLFKDGEICRDYVTDYHPKDDNFDYYDEEPLLEEGEYFWRIRGISAGGAVLTEWSEQTPGNTFKVEKPAAFCALGDSITHGGGSISVPPSTVIYNWQNYCKFPIKNLGKSGDTTLKMLERFEQDILSFNPEILFIMAGVNDYRGDVLAWDSVENLAAIRDKCESYGITPVFITPTPLNPDLIYKIKFIHYPPYDWQDQRQYICDWMRRQKYCIDIANDFSDSNGYLRADLALDGLHPDAEGKEIIGRAVENWLNNYLGAKEEF